MLPRNILKYCFVPVGSVRCREDALLAPTDGHSVSITWEDRKMIEFLTVVAAFSFSTIVIGSFFGFIMIAMMAALCALPEGTSDWVVMAVSPLVALIAAGVLLLTAGWSGFLIAGALSWAAIFVIPKTKRV